MGVGKLLKKPLLLAAGIGYLAAVGYLFGVAEDRYGSESRFTIKSQMEGGAASSLDLGILGGGNAAKQDQLIIRDLLLSAGMMDKVEERFGWEALSASGWDPLYNLDDDAAQRRKLAHYRGLLDFTYDEEAAVSTLVTQAFDAETSRDLNAFLISEAEAYINRFSEKTSEQFVSFAQADLERAQGAVEDVQSRIRKAQEQSKLVSPETDIEVIASTLGKLESRLAELRAERDRLMGFMQEDALQVRTKQQEIAGLERQVAAQRSRLNAGEAKDQDLASASVRFAALQNELEFANVALGSSLKTLEAAKMQAMSSRKYLMLIEDPRLADYAEYPHRWWNSAYLLLLAVAAYMLLANSLTILGAGRR